MDPSRDVIIFATLGGFDSAGNGCCGTGAGGRGGIPNGVAGEKGGGGPPRCAVCAWKTISEAKLGSSSGYSSCDQRG